MKKLLGLLVVLGLLVLLGGTACGGDDDDDGSDAIATAEATGDTGAAGGDDSADVDRQTLEVYFDALAAIADRTNTKLDDVNTRMSSAIFDSEADEVQANQTALEEIGLVLEAAAIDVGNLSTPDVAADEHDAFAAALADYARLASEFYQDLLDAQTMADMNVLFDQYNPTITDAVIEAGDTCLALQTLGQRYIEAVDLACPGE